MRKPNLNKQLHQQIFKISNGTFRGIEFTSNNNEKRTIAPFTN